MTLTDLLASYVASRDCSPRYRESLVRTVRKLGATGITSLCHLESGKINRFLASLSSLSATTRSNIRRELLTLWRYAFEQHLTDEPPLRVLRIRPQRKPTQAWSLKELARLLDCAEADQTLIGGEAEIRICDFMPAWICAAYDTGIRFADMLSLTTKEIRNGCIVKTAHKTGKPLTRPLSKYALQQLMGLAQKSPDGTIFRWFLTRRRAFVKMREFYDRHGFAGSGKYLRRSCATYVERDHPGMAWRYLQHSTPSLVTRHYEDESLLAVPPGPPPIR